MTTDPVVIQRRDSSGRTHIYWYLDERCADAREEVLHVSGAEYHRHEEADHAWAITAWGLHTHELLQDPWADLSWLTTHHETEPAGPIERNRTLGGAA